MKPSVSFNHPANLHYAALLEGLKVAVDLVKVEELEPSTEGLNLNSGGNKHYKIEISDYKLCPCC